MTDAVYERESRFDLDLVVWDTQFCNVATPLILNYLLVVPFSCSLFTKRLDHWSTHSGKHLKQKRGYLTSTSEDPQTLIMSKKQTAT